jgi:hypothetical protein
MMLREQKKFSVEEKHEIAIVLAQLAKEWPQSREVLEKNLTQESLNEEMRLFEIIYGPYCDESLRGWIEEIRQQQITPHPHFLRLATAISGLQIFHVRLNTAHLGYTYQDIVGFLRVALQCERAINDAVRERERIFTKPFTDYTFPLYDHIYNCLVALSSSLPLQKQAP